MMGGQATSRLKVNPPLGTMPVLQFCTLAQLNVDETYQRSLAAPGSQSLIRRIAQFWNWDLCQPLVVARRDNGQLFVVDGQHRLAAAKLRTDIAQLPCVIANYGTAADEAASFVALNQQRRPLNALEIFRAAVAAEDETSIAVVKALDALGLSVAPHYNFIAWKAGAMSNVAAIASAWQRDGAEKTQRALAIIATAFPNKVLRYCGTLFGGVIGALRARAGIDDSALAVALGHLGQNGMRNAVLQRRAENPTEKYAVAAANVVLDLIGSPKIVPAIAPRAAVVVPMQGEAKTWCEQCDRMVSDESARFCVSRFCSLRKSA
jgi:hypothetical protein